MTTSLAPQHLDQLAMPPHSMEAKSDGTTGSLCNISREDGAGAGVGVGVGVVGNGSRLTEQLMDVLSSDKHVERHDDKPDVDSTSTSSSSLNLPLDAIELPPNDAVAANPVQAPVSVPGSVPVPVPTPQAGKPEIEIDEGEGEAEEDPSATEEAAQVQVHVHHAIHPPKDPESESVGTSACSSAALPTCEGFMRKRYSSSLYMGSKRYCRLRGCMLKWYMTEDHARANVFLRGQVRVKALEHWTGRGSVKQYPHAFAIRTMQNKLLLCSCETNEDKHKWIHTIQAALHTHSGDNSNDLQPVEREILCNNQRRITPAEELESVHLTASYRSSRLPSSPWKSDASDFSSEEDLYYSPFTEAECSRCAVRFKKLLARRVVCGSCEKAFCSRHCRQHTILNHLDHHVVRRCCGRCARRQEFIVYSGMLTGLLKRLALAATGFHETLAQSVATERAKSTSQSQLYDATVDLIRNSPMSLVKTIKLLYQTQRKPDLFRHVCERLPVYVEFAIDRVENLWYQILHVLQCCDPHLEQSAFQHFYLKRFIRAICRRSPRIALLTIWHVQAAFEDSSSRHNSNALLSLLGLIFPSRSDNAMLWKDLVHADCPAHQMQEILRSAEQIHDCSEQIIAKETDSVMERWLNAITIQQFQQSAYEICQLDQRTICAYESSIPYDVESVGEPFQLETLIAQQVRFVESLAAIGEILRHVQPVSARSKVLQSELEKLNANLHEYALYPLCWASDELQRVVRIPPNEGKVFSTKMRAPTLIFMETVPVDDAPTTHHKDSMLKAFFTLGRIRAHSAVTPRTNNNNNKLGHKLIKIRDVGRNDCNSIGSQRFRDRLTSSLDDTTLHSKMDRCEEHGSQSTDHEDYKHSESPRLELLEDQDNAGESLALKLQIPSTEDLGEMMSVKMDMGQTKRHQVENLVYESKIYGESWEECCQRIQQESPMGHLPGWKLFSVIVKTNDDLRQEMFTMQLIQKFKHIFERAELTLWLRTYRIVATGANIGLMETITDACSLDHLKKNSKCTSLLDYFQTAYGDMSSELYQEAQQNFIQSMAAYSLVSYVLLVKDRHNGNILLGSKGHIIHIDFGFILGIAPGGMFSIEDAPFKLTVEMVEIMGGLDSSGFKRFRQLLCAGLVALQHSTSEIVAMLQATGQHSPFPCFQHGKLSKMTTALRERLCVGLTRQQVEDKVDSMIRKSYNAWGTRQYDAFQLRSNNIQP